MKTNQWIRITLFSFLLLASLGVLMRYKIGFAFPFLDQKNLQHAHSHFAFAGWVSQMLMVLMVTALGKEFVNTGRAGQYNIILWSHLICAYGMLIFFTLQGYGLFSIFFSTASLIVFFIFAIWYVQDLRQAASILQKQWFYAALVFNILSTAGTFALVVMMATRSVSLQPYLASVYWYLHFQYNGWFFFACMGLWIQYFGERFSPAALPQGWVFWCLAIGCVPAYGLSVVWLNPPLWLHSLIAVAAFGQCVAWVVFMKQQLSRNLQLSVFAKSILAYVAIAASIKLALQLASAEPWLNHLVFGFRPVIIAYLHLVLLAFISVFLVSYLYIQRLLQINRLTHYALFLLLAGIFLNELALAIQGFAAFSYVVVPHINLWLFGISLLLLLSILLLVLSQYFTNRSTT